ncbi:pantetheine-phosphate adenylyltransferase [Aeromicrobium tamlense]|jgi:pantetheine-phosphate adenylyltransferase|uniref:Phosphopantetheine adenylyltransferase n=1 Tax=Aeromicrobium tamlense TaxID=375541 RepID=A0A8I0KLI7_9ACTN|nr:MULTISPECIES: pantetheine-phosphate adenylyltransferase [Aeromicrobium]MBD1268674.1 pantetheine-phosphate adenylyltransferase [Aeromicrobium tamlense]NYI37420.1 pantetheine-phosphate adenylyltransferase [Aeromicrobium tamlense]
MTRVVCPGSFDPVTNGHLDIIERASFLFDEVVVVVLVNESKAGLFPIERRIELIAEATAEMENVTLDSYAGLLVDYCAQNDVQAIVKGLRAVSDFDYELQMAQMNGNLTGIDTVFIPTSPDYTFIASSLVKEVARHGGDVNGLVPKHVMNALDEAFGH